MFVKYQF